jgi:hypothetical protein
LLIEQVLYPYHSRQSRAAGYRLDNLDLPCQVDDYVAWELDSPAGKLAEVHVVSPADIRN